MKTTPTNTTIIRTSRGLTIAGTRITLYSFMDYLKADWPAKLIQDLFDLTDEQMADVLAYIHANREQVEAEYQIVLQKAEENRHYWMAYNQEHLENVAAMPHDPKNQEIWEKLKARQAKLQTP